MYILGQELFRYFQDPGFLRWIGIQYLEDSGFLKWFEVQYFQDPGFLKWLEIQYFQDPGSVNLRYSPLISVNFGEFKG